MPGHKPSPLQCTKRKRSTQGNQLHPKRKTPQTIDELTVANTKEGQTYTITLPTTKTKITVASNDWSSISLI